MAIIHALRRFDPTRTWRALWLTLVACCAVSVANAQTAPPPGRALPATPPTPPSIVIYEGTLAEELAAELAKTGYFGSTARLLSLNTDRMRLEQATSAEFTPGQVERVLVKNWDLKAPLKRSDDAVMGNVFNSADDEGAYTISSNAR